MSYDVSFSIDAGGSEPQPIGEDYNYTWNCSPMFRRALGGDGINDLNGKLCRQAITMLEAAMRDITDPAKTEGYQALNPANKWGSHEGATKFLEAILESCKAHPNATVVVS